VPIEIGPTSSETLNKFAELVARMGRGFFETYLGRPNTTVIATVRDTSSASAQSLNELKRGDGTTLHILKLDSAAVEDAKTVAAHLKEANIKLDVVIANAGIFDDRTPVATTKLTELVRHVEVNAYGPLLLFQAVLPLLHADSKFVWVGSALGSIGGIDQRHYPSAAYGSSKAIVHWLSRKVHQEHKDLISFVVDPGYVMTIYVISLDTWHEYAESR
jgi:norsolorinic acid ketoreductase